MRIPKKRWTALLALLAGLILCGKAAAADGSSFEPMPGVAAASFAPYRLSCTLVNPLPGAPTSFPRGAKPQNCGFWHRGRNLL